LWSNSRHPSGTMRSRTRIALTTGVMVIHRWEVLGSTPAASASSAIVLSRTGGRCLAGRHEAHFWFWQQTGRRNIRRVQ
jgi:hypothetical protein